MKKLVFALSALMAVATFSTSAAEPSVPRTVFVHLFEWQWDDVASECENYLGPNGFSAVQVSPPQKSIGGGAWWTRYQPVSYSVEGRSGTREQFANMVRRCKAANVDIYVDAVINHMAAWDRRFPEVPYGPDDFHNCRDKIDYSKASMVHNCDLDGLNDLKTESDYVRSKITAYLEDLQSMGVAGFRIDAAKHMPPEDVSNIIGRLSGRPYVFQEVIYGSGEAVHPNQYNYISDVTEFQYSNTLGHFFKGRGKLKELMNIGTWGGWLPSNDAVVFVANHDNQRQKTNDIITHKDGGNLNVLAHIFMLGYPYGYPEVMSSYHWDSHDQGPPSSGASGCNNGWLCEHRHRAIKNMVAFRNHTSAAFSVTHPWNNDNNQVAWGRGGLGFVAINREDGGTLNKSFQTGMPAGIYCDIIHADFDVQNGTCSGATITVDGQGNANLSVNSRDAVAFHVGAKVGNRGSSSSSSSVASDDWWYFRGTPNSWGTTQMSNEGGGRHCIQQSFGDASTNPRFKIAHFQNWTESYPVTDYLVSPNATYKICIDAPTKAISVTVVSGSSSSSSSSSAGDKVNVHFVCNNGTTYVGQSVYAVGSISGLGNWTASQAIKLNPTTYPRWEGNIQLPANTTVQWKCLKRDELNASAGIVWQGGSNIMLNTASGTNTTGGF